MNSAGHEPVVKRLFKWAEERGDDELMGAFAVAFDQLVRRKRRMKFRYDYQSRSSWQEEELFPPRNVLAKVKASRGGDVYAHGPLRTLGKHGHEKLLFKYHTRHYLRRRAWRYFRRKGHQKPAEYCAAVAGMLSRYTDPMLAAGENLLDSWSFMHACFRESNVLAFSAAKVEVKEGSALTDLSAAPDFEALWKQPAATAVLVELLTRAQSQAARVWAVQLLRRHHMQRLAKFTPEQILPLLDHPDEQVQQFAAEMLDNSPAMANLDLGTWLKLLQTRNIAALEIITRLMAQYVKPERLTIEQMVEIACAQPVPVARMGLAFLKARESQWAGLEQAREALVELAHARSAGVAGEITTWALSILGSDENYNVDHVSPFFDSLLEPARDAARAWLTPKSRGYSDPAIWSRLIETPYDDIRFHVVAELQRRAKLPGTSVDQVTIVWSTVLLGIHRGGRAKLLALKQISRAIADDPQRAEPLLPVLAVAIRSVRGPEIRSGLAAVVSAVAQHPPLAAAVAKHIPELEIPAEVMA